MENVNNLNGVPNFGFGLPEEPAEVIPTEAETPSIDGVESVPETEVKHGKGKKPGKGS